MYIMCTWILVDLLFAVVGGQHHVEPREIKARMDSTTVQTVIKLGYQRDIVRQVIEKRLRSTGQLSIQLTAKT